MSQGDVLLSSHGGEDGSFHDWLKQLGLVGNSVPLLNELIAWNWIRPVSRVRIPKSFYLSWQNYPNHPAILTEGTDHWAHQRDLTWFIEAGEVRSSPHWFLHPYFIPDEPANNFLRRSDPGTWRRPSSFMHPRGIAIYPYSDFYFHWQAYRLIEILHAARFQIDTFATPDANHRYKRLGKLLALNLESRAVSIERVANRWHDRSATFTALSHYRALRHALLRINRNSSSAWAYVDRGARDLSAHLKLSVEAMESFIGGELLGMTPLWAERAKAGDPLFTKAYGELRADLMLAIEWACKLSGRRFDYYFAKWRKRHWGHHTRAALSEALPYEDIASAEEFVRHSAYYFDQFNKTVGKSFSLGPRTIKRKTKAILNRNPAMWSFVQSYKALHDQLSPSRATPNDPIDFRYARPVDHYRVLAIQGELVLQHEAAARGLHLDKSGRAKGLRGLIEGLAKAKGWPEPLIEQLEKDWHFTQLHKLPTDPMEKLLNSTWPGTPAQDLMRKSLLAFALVRNYLAHHDYWNRGFLFSSTAQFGLSGILLSVLLLGDSTTREHWIR